MCQYAARKGRIAEKMQRLAADPALVRLLEWQIDDALEARTEEPQDGDNRETR